MKDKQGSSTKQIFQRLGFWKSTLFIGSPILLVGSFALFVTLFSLPRQVDISKLDTVTILVNHVSNTSSTVIFQQTIHDPKMVQQIYREITSLHQVKPGENYNCPAGLSVHNDFKLDFFQQGNSVVQATNSVTACAFWEVKIDKGNSNTYCCTSDATWLQWHQKFGLPAPYQNSHV